MPATLSILTNVFVEPHEREKAIGIWAGVAGVGIAVGPIAGGLLLQHFWWGSVFLINVPVIVVGMIAAALLVPNSADPAAPRLDYSALGPGVPFTPRALLLLIAGPASTPLVRRLGTKAVVSTGLLMIAGGLAWLATASANATFVGGVLGPLAILGLGFGLTMAPTTESIMGSLPRAQAGAGSAMNSTLLQVGGALGVAIIGSVLSAGYRSSVDGVMAGHAVPAWVGEIIRSSVGGALEVAHRAGGSI